MSMSMRKGSQKDNKTIFNLMKLITSSKDISKTSQSRKVSKDNNSKLMSTLGIIGKKRKKK
jgi:hypothetical protein